MKNAHSNLINRSILNTSCHRFVFGGAMLAGLGGTLSLNALKPQSSRTGGHTAMGSHDAAMNDAEVLNDALFYEHQPILAYSTADRPPSSPRHARRSHHEPWRRSGDGYAGIRPLGLFNVSTG